MGKIILNSFQKKLHRQLVGVAKGPRGVISYRDLGVKNGIAVEDEFHFNDLAGQIGTVSQYELEHGRPLLSVVVVRNDTQMPGKGFFKFARSLGVMKTTPQNELNCLTFFAEEHIRVRDYWKKRLLLWKKKKN